MMLDVARIAALHSRLQFTITLVLLVLAIWGVISALRAGAGQGYAAGLSVVQLLILTQCILGLIVMFDAGIRSSLALHLVYGATMAAALPAIRRYNQQHPPQRQAWIYAATCLILAGMALRAVATGAV